MANKIDITPCETDLLRRYLAYAAERLGRPVEFLDLKDHPDESAHMFGRSFFDADFHESPTVWVDLDELARKVQPDIFLAHEATHAVLTFADQYPHPRAIEDLTWPEKYLFDFSSSLVEDILVEHRLAEFGFDRSEFYKHVLSNQVEAERRQMEYGNSYLQGYQLDWDYALRYAYKHLLPTRKQTELLKELDKLYLRNRLRARKLGRKIVTTVEAVNDLFTSEGQKQAFDAVANMLGLSGKYEWVVVTPKW